MSATEVKETVAKRKGGRLRAIINYKEAEGLAAVGLTVEMMADYFGISTRTFRRHVARDKFLAALIAQGRAKMAVKLRARLITSSETNTMALIFACKTLAGLNDRQIIEMSGPEGGPIPGVSNQIDQLERSLLLLERFTEARRNGPEDAPAELSAMTLEHEDG